MRSAALPLGQRRCAASPLRSLEAVLTCPRHSHLTGPFVGPLESQKIQLAEKLRKAQEMAAIQERMRKAAERKAAYEAEKAAKLAAERTAINGNIKYDRKSTAAAQADRSLRVRVSAASSNEDDDVD
eukprot:5939661-Prymnesium_polylepis.1